MGVFVHFERGRDEVWGPVFGPYDYVQQTYDLLRVSSPEGEALAVWDQRAGEWFLTKLAGEHEGEFYSDFILAEAAPWGGSDGHDCAAARVTVANDGETEQRWDDAAVAWVPTGRVWDSSRGEWRSQ